METTTPTGRQFLDPEKILRRLKLGPKMVVGDYGCGGGGYFAVQAAQMVGGKGLVWALDVYKPALSACLSKASLAGLTNIKALWSDLEVYRGAKAIKDQTVDLGLLVNVLNKSKKHEVIFREIARTLKPGATLLIIDWDVTGFGFGPEKSDLVPAEEVKSLAQGVGLKLTETLEPSRYHYGLVFRREERK